MTLTPVQIQRLTSEHDRSLFHCGVEQLDFYIARLAGQQTRSKIATVYIATHAQSPEEIRGYYTLSSYAIETDRVRGATGGSLPGYLLTPCTLLGRLAVDLRFQGTGLGRLLIVDALQRALESSVHVASHAVIVDAINSQVATWYQRFGFAPFQDSELQLVLPMKTIERSFSD
jgi:GNAT superfamily N-acetyltransferase